MAFPLQTYGLFSFQLPLFPSICDIIARVHLISGRTSVSYGFNTPYRCDTLQQVERMNQQTIRPSWSRSWNDLIILVAPPPGFEPGTFESDVRRSTSVLSRHISRSHRNQQGFEPTIFRSWAERTAIWAIVTRKSWEINQSHMAVKG